MRYIRPMAMSILIIVQGQAVLAQTTDTPAMTRAASEKIEKTAAPFKMPQLKRPVVTSFFGSAYATPPDMIERAHTMTLSHGTDRWDHAMPTGNGQVGAMVYGNIKNETIILTHDALFIRSEKPELPNVSEYLPQVREMISAGQYDEAGDFFGEKIASDYDYRRPDSFHPAFNVMVDMDLPGQISGRRREVNFETGEVIVSWTQGEVDYERRLFVSRKDDVMVLRIRVSKPGAIHCRVGLLPLGLKRGELGDGMNVRVPRFPSDPYKPKIKLDEVPITFNLFTTESELALLGDYDVLLSRHAALHRELFLRASVNLDADETYRTLNNEDLIRHVQQGRGRNALLERLFDFGRYVLICSSRPGAMPTNLQGIWNGFYAPAWAADYHNDINIQMAYFQALPGNMPEVTLPYDAAGAMNALGRIVPDYLWPNLFMLMEKQRPILQFDASSGVTSAVLEMLVFSTPEMIRLLPALPESWPVGSVEGIQTRAGVEVGLQWDMKQRQMKVKFYSRTDRQVVVKFPAAPLSIETNSKDTHIDAAAYGDEYRLLTLPAGIRVQLQVHLTE